MFLCRLTIAAVFLFSFFASQYSAYAIDNGVIKVEVPDAAAIGMGGAFTGEADRPSAVYYNPAGLTQMGTEISAGITYLQPQIEFKALSNGQQSSMIRDNYIFPHIYVTTPIYKDRIFLGFGENSNFASGNNWGPNSFSRYTNIKDSFENRDYILDAAYKINDQWSVAAGAILDESKLESTKALFQGPNDGNALFKATDDAWGFNLGALFKLNDWNQFGLTYKSPIHHKYEGGLYLNNLNHDGFDFASIFAGTAFYTKAIQKFTLPQSVTLGYSTKPLKKWKFNFDLEWTDWSNTKQETTSYPSVNTIQASILSVNNPTQRSWRSVWSESVGAEYALLDNLRLRTGYAHHQSPIPKSTIDTTFPDSDSNSITAGFGVDITKNLTLDIAYVAVFYVTHSIVNTADANISGKYSEFVNIGTATLTYKF